MATLMAMAMGGTVMGKEPGVVEMLCPTAKYEKFVKADKKEKKGKKDKKNEDKKNEEEKTKVDKKKDIKLDAKDAKQTANLAKLLKAIQGGGNIDAADAKGQTALMFAASLGNRTAVCWLVAKGADVTLKTKSGKTAADYARDVRTRELLELCAHEKEPLSEEEKYYYLTVDRAKTPEELGKVPGEPWIFSLTECATRLRAGADARTMLYRVFSTYGMYSAERLAYILRQGYDVKNLEKDGIFSYRDLPYIKEETLRLLLALGVKPNMDNASEREAFHLAQKSGDIATARQLLSKNPEFEEQANWRVKMPDTSKAESLSRVLSWWRDPAGVRALLAAGANPNAEANYYLPLHEVISMHLNHFGDNSYTNAILTAASALGIDMSQGGMGYSVRPDGLRDVPPAMPLIALPGDLYGCAPEMVDILIAAGANPETEYKGDTPLTLALKRLTRAVAINSISGQYIPCDAYASIIQSLIKAKAPVPKDALLRLPMGLRDGVAPAACAVVAEALLKAGADPRAKDDEGRTTLMTAGSYTPALAKKLLKAGVNPKAKTKDGWTALHSAQTAEVAALLLKAGADVKAETTFKKRGTPLQNALKMSNSPQLAEHVQLLLDAKAEVEPNILLNLAMRSPRDVKFTAFETIAKALVKAGADPNICWEGNFPAHALLAVGAKTETYSGGANALLAARPQDVEALVKAGADINAQDNKGNTPLMTAARQNDYLSIKQLFKLGAKLDVADKGGETPISLAKKNTDALLAFIRAGIKLPPSEDVLSKALELCSNRELSAADCKAVEKFITQLIDKGSGIKLPSDILLKLQGENALSRSHNATLLPVHIALNTNVARALLDAGADPKAKDGSGRTTLMSTCFCDIEITKRLLEGGVDVKASAENGLTALHLVRTPEAMELLLKAGADREAIAKVKRNSIILREGTEIPCTPLTYTLVKNSWDDGEKKALVEAFIKAGAKVKGDGWDALFEAAANKGVEKDVATLLIKAGADPNARDAQGRTWLMLNPLFITACDADYPGLNINAQDKEGMTALMYLSVKVVPNDLSFYGMLIRSFIKKGAKTNLRNKEGKTVLELVKKELGDYYAREFTYAGVKE